jgi:hypothetical protein
VDKGKVYMIHREFPLNQHPYALEAACYACAAHRVGKWEQVCDVLFRKQESWAASGKVDETVCSVLMPDEAKRVRALAKDPSIIAEVRGGYPSRQCGPCGWYAVRDPDAPAQAVPDSR